jgi:hypothetical protein
MKKNFINAILALTIPATIVLSSCSQGSSPSNPILSPDNISTFSQPVTRVVTTLPPGTKELGAAMFSYIVMDDKLSQFGISFLKALEAGANDKAYYTAFADLQGDESSYIFRITPSKDMGKLESVASYLSPDKKEVTSNDPKVLSQAVNWAFSNYQGKVKVFDILAHGGGYMGLGTDDFQTGDTKRSIMEVNEFATGLKNGLKGRKLDVVNMLSCLMGNLEAVYELRDVTNYLIVSEDSIRASNDTTVEFTKRLAEMVGQPNPNPREIARTMEISANANNEESGYSTIAAVDMSRIKDVKSAVNVLGNEILRAFPQHKDEIIGVYDAVPELIVSPRTGQRDLWALCKGLAKLNIPALRNAALNVVKELKTAMLHQNDKEGPAANGLSIFMPHRKEQLNLPNDFDLFTKVSYVHTRFAKDTGWDKVIETIFNSK